MSGIVLAMLSSTSLAAFSSATTTSPVNGNGPVRLVREPIKPNEAPQQTFKNALPTTPPGIVPPRGSLLNLSI